MNLPVAVKILDHDERVTRLVAMFVRTRKSEHTREAYTRDLKLWVDWCRDTGINPIEVRTVHVQLWISGLREAGLSDATQARRLAVIASWYEWLLREETINRNPARLRREERPKAQRDVSPTPVLSAAQTERLLAAADADPDPRSAAALALLIYTGMRVGELTACDVEDITTDRGHPVLPIRGKGGKERIVPLPPPLYERIERYLRSRQDGGDRLPTRTVGASARRPLIATATGRRVDRAQIHRLIQRFARAAGGDLADLAKRISPHSLRHSYVTDLLDDGVPVRDVQYAVGHADPRTTERYDRGRLRLDRHPTYRRAGQIGSRDGG